MKRTKKKKSPYMYVVFGTLGALLLWQSLALYSAVRRRVTGIAVETKLVEVRGNVQRPGVYRVVDGTTAYEILQVAGVRPTSDLAAINLSGQVEEDRPLNVGSSSAPASLNSFVRLEFLLDQLTVLSADGASRNVGEGMEINEGDRLICEENSQAELSMNSFSRIDMDSYSELEFDKIGEDRNGKRVTQLFQRAGLCWYQIVYARKSELVIVNTPLGMLTVGGKGAGFTVEVSYSEVTVSNRDGFVLIEREETGESMNLIAGQSVTIYEDGRPFSVSRVSEDMAPAQRFSGLAEARVDAMVDRLPFNFLFVAEPSSFYVFSISHTDKLVQIVRMGARTSISDFTQGYRTLQESVLKGGTTTASSVAERILGVRIPKYAQFTKEDVIKTAQTIGGVSLDVDDAAAASIGISGGVNALKGLELIQYLKPSISGSGDAERRQMGLLRAIYGAIAEEKIVLNPIMLEGIISGVNTNISATEAMKQYKLFTAGPEWKLRMHSLPTRPVRSGNTTVEEPILEECRALLKPEE